MILSHSKKFIFIHVYKVAGTSISKELAKYNSLILPSLRAYRFLAARFPKVLSNKYHRHVTASELKDVVADDVFSNYYKFGFVRNPWDWQVSLYHYMLRKKNHHQRELTQSLQSFDAYIHWLVTTNITTQKDMLADKDGNIIVDFVGRYENLNEDFAKVCQDIGIQDAHLPHLNQTKKKHYTEYYNETTRELIEKAYQEDIKEFGYKFE